MKDLNYTRSSKTDASACVSYLFNSCWKTNYKLLLDNLGNVIKIAIAMHTRRKMSFVINVCHQFLSILYWSNIKYWSQARIQIGIIAICNYEIDNYLRLVHTYLNIELNIQSGRHVLLNRLVSNPFGRHFCGKLVTTKHDFNPLLFETKHSCSILSSILRVQKPVRLSV